MGTVLLIVWVILQYFLLSFVFKANGKMWYFRGRRDSYQHMLDDIDKWQKSHPKMDVNEHWETALGLKEFREIRKQHEDN